MSNSIFCGKTLLITGGTGSFGNAILNRFLQTDVGEIRIFAHYNLDVIIAIGYRVQSPVATRFRRWATARLHEFIQKGFAFDDERLKNGRNRYFKAYTEYMSQYERSDDDE